MDAASGDDCVKRLDLSPWVSLPDDDEKADSAILTIKLKASSAVNSCDPHLVLLFSSLLLFACAQLKFFSHPPAGCSNIISSHLSGHAAAN